MLLKNILPYTTSGPYNKWHYSCSQLINWHTFLVTTTDNKMRRYPDGGISSGVMYVLCFIKICQLVSLILTPVIQTGKRSYTSPNNILKMKLHFFGTLQIDSVLQIPCVKLNKIKSFVLKKWNQKDN